MFFALSFDYSHNLGAKIPIHVPVPAPAQASVTVILEKVERSGGEIEHVFAK